MDSVLPQGPKRSFDRVERWALFALFGYTLVALMGYVGFGLNPQNLPGRDFAIRIYQVAFVVFSRAQIVISGLVLFVVLYRNARLRWLPAFGAVYLISFTAEHVGTGYGIPFSGYEYTALLGPRLGPRVPLVIPMSWFLMSAPSWILARAVFPEARSWLGRIVVGSLLLVTWDLALDPAMSNMTTYWLWETRGSFYGMPWINLLGWFATGLAIFSALEVLQQRTDWAGSLSTRWSAAYYAGVLLMPLGMVTAGGLWGSTAATLAAIGGLWLLHSSRAARRATAAGALEPEREALTAAAGSGSTP